MLVAMPWPAMQTAAIAAAAGGTSETISARSWRGNACAALTPPTAKLPIAAITPSGRWPISAANAMGPAIPNTAATISMASTSVSVDQRSEFAKCRRPFIGDPADAFSIRAAPAPSR